MAEVVKPKLLKSHSCSVICRMTGVLTQNSRRNAILILLYEYVSTEPMDLVAALHFQFAQNSAITWYYFGSCIELLNYGAPDRLLCTLGRSMLPLNSKHRPL